MAMTIGTAKPWHRRWRERWRRRWRKRRRKVRPVLRLAMMALGAVAAAPFVLTIVLIFADPPVSALMVWRGLAGTGMDYRWVDLDRIAPALPVAVITREDSRFCSHHGVDWDAVGSAIDDRQAGFVRGASTIPMQVAKNMFLWPQRSYVRKVLEVPLAYWLDLLWGKRRVIEVYLNIAEWGPGIYGAEAAARRYFSKPAAALSLREAALLAVALPNPLARRPARPDRLTRMLAARAQRQTQNTAAQTGCIGS